MSIGISEALLGPRLSESLEMDFTSLNDSADEARKGPQHFIGNGCAYWDDWKASRHQGHGTCWVTLSVEWEEDGLYLELECDSPHPEHWLGYLESFEPIGDSLDLSGWRDWPEQLSWLLEHGLVPGQRFLAEVYFEVFEDFGGESDYGVEWRIIDREPVAAVEAASRLEQVARLAYPNWRSDGAGKARGADSRSLCAAAEAPEGSLPDVRD